MSKAYAYMKKGMNPKQAVAKMLSERRKMAKGGYVEGSDGDLDQEHERSLAELMIQGDQPPIANPEQMDAELSLAKNLHEEAEKEEYYAMGGLVEGADGDETPEPKDDGPPRIAAAPMSKEAMEAIAHKKKMRRFMK